MDYEFAKFAEYSAVDQERLKLAGQAATASEFTRALYEAGLQAAEARLAALREDPEFSERVTALYAPVEQAYAELDGLQTAVDKGLIDGSLLDQARLTLQERIAANPDLSFAVSLYAGSQAVDKQVELDTTIPQATTQEQEKPEEDATPTSPPSEAPASPEADKQPKPLTITLRGDTIKIGQSRQYIKLSNRIHEGQQDYSKERLKLLETLIKHSGESVPVKKLWDETFPGQELDGSTLAQFRSWMTKLTYGRKPIINFNRKRGPASAYGITDFDVTYVQQRQRKAKVAAPVPTGKGKRSSSTSTQEAISSQDLASAEAADTEYFPLTAYETLVVAEFLQIHGEILQQQGLSTIDERGLQRLREIPTERAQKDMIERYGSVPDARRKFLQELRTFLEDNDRLEEAIANMSDNDPRYPVFTYFFELEGDDRWNLLSKLVSAEPAMDINVILQPHGGTCVVGVQSYTDTGEERYPRSNDDPGDAESAPVTPSPDTSQPPTTLKPEVTVTVHVEQTPASDQNQPSPSKEAPETKPTAVPAPTVNEPAPTANRPEASSTNAPAQQESDAKEWEKSFRQEIGAAIEQLAQDGLMKPGALTARIVSKMSSSNKLGTDESLRRMRQAGIIKRWRGSPSNLEMTPGMIVKSFLFNQNQRGVLSKNDRSKQKRALELIEEAVDSYIRRLEQS